MIRMRHCLCASSCFQLFLTVMVPCDTERWDTKLWFWFCVCTWKCKTSLSVCYLSFWFTSIIPSWWRTPPPTVCSALWALCHHAVSWRAWATGFKAPRAALWRPAGSAVWISDANTLFSEWGERISGDGRDRKRRVSINRRPSCVTEMRHSVSHKAVIMVQFPFFS